MSDINFEEYGRIIVDGEELTQFDYGDDRVERAVPATTTKSNPIQFKPTRVTGGDGVTYPAFAPEVVLPSFKAFGADPVKHKAPALWGRYVPAVASDTTTYPMVDANGAKFVKDIGLDGTGTDFGYYNEATGEFVKAAGASGTVIQPIAYAEIPLGGYLEFDVTNTQDTRWLADADCDNAKISAPAPWLGGFRTYIEDIAAAKQTIQFAGTASGINRVYSQYGSASEHPTNMPSGFSTRDRHTYECNANGILIDGTVVYTETAETFVGTDKLKIGAVSSLSEIVASFTGKCYKVQCWRDGIHQDIDAIPVRIGTTVELLDLVNWQFATRTGTFTAGADIPYAQLQSDIIKVNTGDLKYGYADGVVLPDEYERVEYIENHGTEYIDTGIVISSLSNPEIEYTFKMVTQADTTWFGAVSSNYKTIFYNVRSTKNPIWYARWGSVSYNDRPLTYASGKSARDLVFLDDFHTVKLTGTTNLSVYVDDKLVGTNTYNACSFDSPRTIGLFRASGGSGSSLSSGKRFKIKDNGVLLGDFISVKKKSSNEYGMYDLVTKAFFGNAGTDAFTGGSVIPRGIYTTGSHKLRIEDEDGNVIERDIPMLLSADSFVDTQADSNNKSEAWAVIWYDGTQTVPSGYISEYGDLRPNQIVLYPLATPAVSTHAIDKVELTAKQTYTVTSEAELPVTEQATYLGVG